MVFIIISSHFPCRYDLQHHHQRPCADQDTTDQGFRGEFLMQENKGQHQRDDHAQLVDGYDFGRLPDLQSFIVAQP